jgi:hypothetical protein
LEPAYAALIRLKPLPEVQTEQAPKVQLAQAHEVTRPYFEQSPSKMLAQAPAHLVLRPLLRSLRFHKRIENMDTYNENI